jgi:lipoprotein-anchoring transpeptidase ErfK/SrfK
MLNANTEDGPGGPSFAAESDMRVITIFCCAAVMSTTAVAQAPRFSDVATAQVMLDRAGFSPGEIDGRAGANLERAVSAFQQANGLQVTGQLDGATLQALSERMGGQSPLVGYTITPDDVNGPFTPDIPPDLMQQATLRALRYRTPLEALAEKFHASPALLQQLNPTATFKRAGEELRGPNVEAVDVPTGPRPGVTIYVTTATSALTVEDEAGKLLFHAPVTSGSEHDPLPIGSWKVTRVQRMPTFNYNPDLFWDADRAHAKARIAPGPNNPVGTVWIDLTKEHYGLHGTPEPSRIGHTQSHGCVRLTNWDIQRVARWAVPGTPVIFR